MTLGGLRLRLLKQFPKLDLDMLDGFIADRHSEIVEALAWTRLRLDAILETVAPYDTGTVAVTNGSSAVTLTGGTWTTGMTGRSFRAGTRSEFYTFAYVSATTGTLNRAYEGDTDAAASYRIFKNIYALPANCRILEDDAFANFSLGPLKRLSRAELNLSAAARGAYGTPSYWASSMDDSSSPPNLQIELYPVPDRAIGIPYEYVAEASVPGTASAAFLPWMEPSTALFEGVCGKIYRTPAFKDLAASQLAAAAAKEALSTMRANETRRMGPATFKMDNYFTRHRRNRGC